MSSRFSAVLLAGGRSSRMGANKAFIEIEGVPLWQRQLQMLEALRPHELFIAGPPHHEWHGANCVIVPDAEPNAGPLGGITAALQRCSAARLLVAAVDLPNMTSSYLGELAHSSADDCGVVPRYGDRFEPLAAIYPKCSLALAQRCLALRDLSVQRFVARCVAGGLALEKKIAPEERPLFLNMNTPEDLATLTNA